MNRKSMLHHLASQVDIYLIFFFAVDNVRNSRRRMRPHEGRPIVP
jgi:hypothetical protein